MKLLAYTHPVAMGYNVNQTYTLEELQNKLSIDEIKTLFSPLNFKWEQPKKKVEEITE